MASPAARSTAAAMWIALRIAVSVPLPHQGAGTGLVAEVDDAQGPARVEVEGGGRSALREEQEEHVLRVVDEEVGRRVRHLDVVHGDEGERIVDGEPALV